MTFIRLLSSLAIISLGCGTAWAQDDLWTIDKSELEDSSDIQAPPEAPPKSIYDTLLERPSEDKPSETKPASIYDQLLSDTPYAPSVQPQADSQTSEPRKFIKFDPEAGRRFVEKAKALAAKREEAERAARLEAEKEAYDRAFAEERARHQAEQQALTDELLTMVKETDAAMEAYLAQPATSRKSGKKADTFLDVLGLVSLETVESEWDILVEYCATDKGQSEIACAWITED